MNEFDHEKLDVYVAAIDFVALADEIERSLLPHGQAVRDRVGGGRASRSCICVGVWVSSRRRGCQAGRELLLRPVAMLVQMVRRTGKPGTGSRSGSAR